MSKRVNRKPSALSRSKAAKRGWITQRRNAQKEFRRRSQAAKKGWRRRKAKAKIIAKAKAQPKAKRGRLTEWIVTWKYLGSKRPRTVDFYVIARSKEDAELFVVKAVSKGQDSNGADLTWMLKIPWNEVSSFRIEEEHEEKSTRAEIQALGEGYVEMR